MKKSSDDLPPSVGTEKQEKKASVLNRQIAGLMSRRQSASKVSEITDSIVISIKPQSEGEKLDAENVIKAIVFPESSERRQEVKPTNTRETIITVKPSEDNRKIEITMQLSQDKLKQMASASQLEKLVGKISNSFANGAVEKVKQDTGSDTVKELLSTTKQAKNLKVDTPSVTFAKK